MKMDDWKLSQQLKIERTLNFSTIPQDEDEFGFSSRKITRDPMSHRIIEKRRRDRMNNCLADLSRLIPHQYMKKGRGRIEKTEIIEMAIKHLKHLQAHSCKDPASCEVAKVTEQESQHHYRLGFQECMSEAVRFLVEAEVLFPTEGSCVRLLAHLQEHYDKLTRGCYATGRISTTAIQEEKGRIPMDIDPNTASSGYAMDGYSLKRSCSPCYEPPPKQHQPLAHHEQAADDSRHNLPTNDASRLREMLQNPNVPVERVRSNSISSTASSYCSRPCVSVYDGYANLKATNCSEEVYKFKNNIKDRFNADVHHHVEETPRKFSVNSFVALDKFPNPGTSKTKIVHDSVTLELPINNTQHDLNVVKIGESDLACANSQTDPQTDSSNGSSSPRSNGRSNGSSSGYSTSGDSPPKTKPQSRSQSPDYERREYYSAKGPPDSREMIPIFALHPKKNFYIPMSVEASIIGPYLSSIEDAVSVLHPISISVNFCRPITFAGSEQVAWQPQHQQQQHQHNELYERYREANF